MNTKVIYTAIFGGYDALQEPTVRPDGWDFVCFSDQQISSKTWDVRVVEPTEGDPTRTARKYKILPHRYLGSYDVSIWMDGNLLVRGDVNELVEKHLQNTNVAVFDHAHARHRDKEKSPDVSGSVREQLEKLLAMAEKGRVKDDPAVMQAQYERYQQEGFPDDNGILLSMVLLRRHNEPDVREAMELWWQEVKKGSKRDQLSFNYAAWKTGLDFVYIKENVRENDYFLHMPHKK